MKKNMGTLDKGIRFAAAALIAILYFTNVIGGTLAIILAIIAVIFVLTSFMNFCPLYTLVGVNTCKVQEKE